MYRAGFVGAAVDGVLYSQHRMEPFRSANSMVTCLHSPSRATLEVRIFSANTQGYPWRCMGRPRTRPVRACLPHTEGSGASGGATLDARLWSERLHELPLYAGSSGRVLVTGPPLILKCEEPDGAVRISSPESLGVATAPVRALAHDGQWLGRARHCRAATAKCPAEERLSITTCWCTPNDCCHKTLLSHRIPAVASWSTPTAEAEGRVMSSWSRTSA